MGFNGNIQFHHAFHLKDSTEAGAGLAFCLPAQAATPRAALQPISRFPWWFRTQDLTPLLMLRFGINPIPLTTFYSISQKNQPCITLHLCILVQSYALTIFDVMIQHLKLAARRAPNLVAVPASGPIALNHGDNRGVVRVCKPKPVDWYRRDTIAGKPWKTPYFIEKNNLVSCRLTLKPIQWQ